MHVFDGRVGQMHGTRRNRRWLFEDRHRHAAIVVREEAWVDDGGEAEPGDATVFAEALARRVGWSFPA